MFSFTLLQFVGIVCDFQFLRKGISLVGSCLISFQEGDIKTACKVGKSEAKDHSSETAAEDLKRHLWRWQRGTCWPWQLSGKILVYDFWTLWTLLILNSSNVELFEFWTLWILNSSKFELFEFWTLWILNSLNFELFEFWTLCSEYMFWTP